MSKEIEEKQNIVKLLKENIEKKSEDLNNAKKNKEFLEKQQTSGYMDIQKLNNFGQQLKSKVVLMSFEGQQAVDSINKVSKILIKKF